MRFQHKETIVVDREVMQYDMVVVGAGPAGLACAIRFKQQQPGLSVCVLEKGAEVGSHILSGAVMQPDALDELLPEWRKSYLGIRVAATIDKFRFMTKQRSWWFPLPPQLNNHGNFIVSLGALCAWMASKAEELEIDVFPGFTAAQPLFENSAVIGVRCGDMGVSADDTPGPNFAAGVDIHAKLTVLAEGCRGSVSKQLIREFQLDKDCSPQTYGLGFKELWQLPDGRGQAGLIQHSVGWPLNNNTYGGS
ncbi:MAG: NAD(P)/FAD-dependent oxidoreductase, partial [Gammaproteobacteria bacterium]